jgi:hypothetical protein
MLELCFFDRYEKHRPGPEVERNRSVFLELRVDGRRLREKLVDPGCGLAEQEAAVAPGGACSDASRLDDDDLLAGLGEKARDGTAGEPRSDDDRIGGQLCGDSSSRPRRLRQKRRPPRTAPTPATIAEVLGTRDPSRVPGTAPFAFRLMTRFATGLPIV